MNDFAKISPTLSDERVTPLQAAFGAAVRRRRYEKAISLQALAIKADLHWNYLGSVERGERNISLANIWRIASGLEVTITELLGELELSSAKAEPTKKSKKAKRAKKAPILLLIHNPTAID